MESGGGPLREPLPRSGGPFFRPRPTPAAMAAAAAAPLLRDPRRCLPGANGDSWRFTLRERAEAGKPPRAPLLYFASAPLGLALESHHEVSLYVEPRMVCALLAACPRPAVVQVRGWTSFELPFLGAAARAWTAAPACIEANGSVFLLLPPGPVFAAARAQLGAAEPAAPHAPWLAVTV